MEMHSVESSNVASIGWETDVLRISFKNGGVYDYFDVPEAVYKELSASESVGHYLAVQIKGVYNFKKVN